MVETNHTMITTRMMNMQICLESLASAKVLKLPCSHASHAKCVEKLREFRIKQVCPLWRRADLPPGPEQLVDDVAHRYMVLYRRYNQGTDDTSRRIRSVEIEDL